MTADQSPFEPETPSTPDPAVYSPLAAYDGAVPPAPDWARAALAEVPETLPTMVDDAAIEVLAWGRKGSPGVVLVHGNGAHARWWSFIAPMIAAQGWRVAAFSLSGMGGSDWRAAYSLETYAGEIAAVADVAGLRDHNRAPAIVAHSFGGFPSMAEVVAHPHRWSGLMMLDSTIPPPSREWKGPPMSKQGNRIYPTLEAALARFRLAPPQPCDTHWALDWIARHGLKQVDGGWTWRFDPFLWQSFKAMSAHVLMPQITIPLTAVTGAQSVLADQETLDHMAAILPPHAVLTVMAEAGHHLLLDQPQKTCSLIVHWLKTL